MQADYAEGYAELARRHWWWRSRQALVLERLARLPARAGSPRLRILDIGCGPGVVLDALATLGDAEGLEPDASLASMASGRAPIRIGRFGPDFRADRPYDLVTMLDVLEHLDDDLGCLRAARGALAPGGRLLLTVPALPWLWSRHDVANEHRRRYRKSGLDGVLRRAGFEVEEIRHAFAWTVGPMVARRWLAPAGGGGGRPYRVSVPARPVNAMLATLSRADHAVGRHVPWPIGSSLLALARRGGDPGEKPAQAGAA